MPTTKSQRSGGRHEKIRRRFKTQAGQSQRTSINVINIEMVLLDIGQPECLTTHTPKSSNSPKIL
jgi:hypothetical protein